MQKYAILGDAVRRSYTDAMNDQDLRKLNAIVGSAIKALVETGADDALIGSFAATHRSKVAEILGHKEHVTESPDLLELVTQAVRTAMGDAGIQARLKQPSTRRTRRVYVNVAGRRTSLTLSSESLDGLAKAYGGAKSALAAIQSLIESAPPGIENRSRWVDERLAGLISSNGAGLSAAHH